MYVYEGYRIPEKKSEITMFHPYGCAAAMAVLVNDAEPNRVMKTPYSDEDIEYDRVSMNDFIRTAREMVNGTTLFLLCGIKEPMPSFIVSQ